MQDWCDFPKQDYPHGIAKSFPYKCHTPANIVLKLQKRQGLIGTPAEEYHHERSFHQCLVPNYTETNVQIPSGYLRKFSPDGNLLIGFSSDQRNLDVYDYFGAGAGQSMYVECYDPISVKQNLFSRFFKLRHSVHVPSDLNRECSLFTENSRYVILGSSSPLGDAAFPHMYDLLRNNEGISSSVRSPVEDYALYMIDLYMGLQTDTISYRFDKIYLAHNQGLSLCGSTLAVLSVQHQTIHLYRVDGGMFTHLQDIGEFCHPDASMIYGQVRFTATDSDDEDQESLVQHPYHNRWFNSLKHRILCYTYKKACSLCTPLNKDPLSEYYKKFDRLVSLRLWKIQLMSEKTLLLKYAEEDIVSVKQTDTTPQPAVFVFYDIETTDVQAMFDNKSEELLWMYENFADEFRSPVSHPLARGTSSVSNNPHARALHQKFKQTITSAKNGGQKEATRRLLGQLPVASQCLSSSPYLDLSLFSYDDKWVSAVERPKLCGDNPVKFFSRDGGHSSFHLETALRGNTQPISRRLIAYIFHPTEPFIISVQKATSRGMEYVVSFHFRNISVKQAPIGNQWLKEESPWFNLRLDQSEQ